MKSLDDTCVVLHPDLSATVVDVTPTMYQELDRRFEGFKGRTLVGSFEFTEDWPTWEMHPAGDEIVLLLSGEAQMVLDLEGAHRAVILEKPGSYVIVPKGTWHTARISKPTRMLFITPGEGTENKAIA
jgi:mannose-6-phosphate isomerase-like protein (cupin superfamily)